MIDQIINSVVQVSAQSIKDIEQYIEMKTIQKGEIFIRKNKRDVNEYFLLDGICRSFLYNPEGETVTLSFYITNSTLSPYTTRTKKELSILNFQALTDLKIARINAHKFEELMIQNLEIRRFGHTVLQNELSKKVNKEIALASLPAKERLLIFREEYPMLENLIPHTDIASYLGITNISLSRLRSKLSR
ncbi:MAG: Crp/Fnr family transcriptional regulator [Saprospiraceae bacterium]|nr:Crp/Fnr family transcriptional regulator [Saprospiraceae bacterium]